MRWVAIAVPAIGLIGFLFYWYLRWNKVSALATVARVDLKIGANGEKEYETRVRLFDQDLVGSDEWRPLGSFPSASEAAAAIQKFHGDRVTPENWCAFFDEYGKSSLVHLGTLWYQGRSAQD